jgi:hypothetical protein
MATQRVIPVEEDIDAPKIITIDQNLVPSCRGCFIAGSGQQAVNFVNNAGFACTITFDNNPISGTVFNSPINLTASGSGSNVNVTPPSSVAGATVNYYISAGAVNTGPYSIQIGGGPLYIQFKVDSLGIVVNPTPIAIPPAGTLEMVSGDGNTYNINWTNGVDPFTPPIATADGLIHTENVAAAIFAYTVSEKSPLLRIGHGGGTIIVTS